MRRKHVKCYKFTKYDFHTGNLITYKNRQYLVATNYLYVFFIKYTEPKTTCHLPSYSALNLNRE